jgi:hypothetical protein
MAAKFGMLSHDQKATWQLAEALAKARDPTY